MTLTFINFLMKNFKYLEMIIENVCFCLWKVETKRATPREEFGKPEAGQTVKKVFVGGLKEDMGEDDIRTYFEQFGKIVTVTRLTEKDTGKPRGFGFVEFDDYDPVDKAILKGTHNIKGKRVDVKKAVSKQEMNSMGGGPEGGMRGGGAGGRRVSLSFIRILTKIIACRL